MSNKISDLLKLKITNYQEVASLLNTSEWGAEQIVNGDRFSFFIFFRQLV